MTTGRPRRIPTRRVILIAVALAAAVATSWQAIRIASDGPGPGLGFRHHTGLTWPTRARVLRSADSHGGFHGDGEHFLVGEVDEAALQAWLAGRAPWGEWRRGPVPGEIGFHCGFGGPGVAWSCSGVDCRYTGDAEVAQLLSSDEIWFSARDRSGRLPWHEGDLLIIDIRSRRLWLSKWDF